MTFTNVIAAGASTNLTVSNLVAGATYYFAATAYNTSGVETGYSNEVTVVIAPPGDTQPPVISSVASSGIGTSSATISWATNEGATTQVEYGLTTAYGSMTALMPFLLADRFGRHILGATYGVQVFFVMAIGGSTGPMITGYIYDMTGSYDQAWLLHLAVLVIVTFLILTLKKPGKISATHLSAPGA